MNSAMRVLGLDPGLRHTGWGVIDVAGNRLSHVADGVVHPPTDPESLARRLLLDGVLVRPMGSFGFPRAFRVTVGTRPENLRFLRAMRALGSRVRCMRPGFTGGAPPRGARGTATPPGS